MFVKRTLPTGIQIVILLAIVLLVYGNALYCGFVWDDEDLIVKNPKITSFDHPSNFFKIEPFYRNYFRPIISISFALDYQIWKLNPFGYHLSNLIFHLISVMLIYFVFLRFLPRISAFLVALIFGIHPIHTEAVTWISGRSDVLCVLFYLTSILCFLNFWDTRSKRNSGFLYFLSCLFFFCALLSKEMAATLPLILAAWIFFFSNEFDLNKQKPKNKSIYIIPFFIILLIYLVWRKLVVGNWLYSPQGPEILFLGWQTTIWIILKYVQLLLLPWKLSAFYDILPNSEVLNFSSLFGSLFFISSLIFVFIYCSRKTIKLITFGLLWFILTLLPISNLIPTTNIYLAERYVYLPSLGYCLIMGWFLGGLVFRKNLASHSLLRIILTVALISLSFLYAWRTITRNTAWKDNFTFSQGLLQTDTHSVYGHYYLGLTYAQKGENEKSKSEYLTTLSLKPDMRGPHFNLGILYYQEGDIPQAKEEFKKEIEIDPSYAEAYYNLGTIYKNSGVIDSAVLFLQKAINIDPGFTYAYINLAVVYQSTGSNAKALSMWEKALTLKPDSLWLNRINENIRNIKATIYQENK
jgi:tetratricopeptide (TPR) repeat protein